MTLGEVRDELRERKLVEASTDFYSDHAVLDMVIDASREVAGAFRFPKVAGTVSVGAGSVSFAVPSGTRDVESVSFEGVSCPRVSLPYVVFLQKLLTESWPRGWNFDPSRGGTVVEVGPPTPVGEFRFLYVGPVYSGNPVAGTQVWDGLYPEFHDLVTLRAAVKSFEMGFEYENAQYYVQRYQMGMQEFSAFLGAAMPKHLMVEGGKS